MHRNTSSRLTGTERLKCHRLSLSFRLPHPCLLYLVRPSVRLCLLQLTTLAISFFKLSYAIPSFYSSYLGYANAFVFKVYLCLHLLQDVGVRAPTTAALYGTAFPLLQGPNTFFFSNCLRSSAACQPLFLVISIVISRFSFLSPFGLGLQDHCL